MMPPTTTNGITLRQRVDPSTGVEVIAARRRWLCWPLCVVSYELASEPDVLPLNGMMHAKGATSGVDVSLYRESIYAALIAPELSPRSVKAQTIGIPWWAKPLADIGTRNRVALLDGGHPVVRVVWRGEVLGFIAASIKAQHDGPPRLSDWPTHDIHGRPWGTGADPTGQRFSTPFDGEEG